MTNGRPQTQLKCCFIFYLGHSPNETCKTITKAILLLCREHETYRGGAWLYYVSYTALGLVCNSGSWLVAKYHDAISTIFVACSRHIGFVSSTRKSCFLTCMYSSSGASDMGKLSWTLLHHQPSFVEFMHALERTSHFAYIDMLRQYASITHNVLFCRVKTFCLSGSHVKPRPGRFASME